MCWQSTAPHWVDLDAGEVKEIKGFTYLPRQNGNNGNINVDLFYLQKSYIRVSGFCNFFLVICNLSPSP